MLNCYDYGGLREEGAETGRQGERCWGGGGGGFEIMIAKKGIW